jgi:hypothetical protein
MLVLDNFGRYDQAMSAPKFPAQEYYDVQSSAEIMDLRVTELVDRLATMATSEVTEPAKRWQLPYANKLEKAGYAARDGDVSSGCVEFLHVTKPDDTKVSVMRSWLGDNESGLPVYDCSWSAEFDDASVAEKFWAGWAKSFRGEDFATAASDFIKNNSVPSGTIRAQHLGLLIPWYMQKRGDLPFMNRYSTVGDKIASVPRTHEPNTDFVVGQVYRAPKREWYTTKVTEFAARTCLAAFTVKPSPRAGYYGQPARPEQAYIQWGNGVLASYNIDSEPAPQPLRTRDLERAFASVQQ